MASRLLARIPTTAVAWNCLGAAILALICHLIWEPMGWPQGANLWAILALGLGLGPVGSAFFTWDIGMKRVYLGHRHEAWPGAPAGTAVLCHAVVLDPGVDRL
ncbi:hypothetical protein OM427_28115 [Halomonas sp. 18H]|uniref:hypothetical protein n=1 Tax=Halomonas almeriensis TaxID=308163 RepID=UPI00222E23A7|nr:MULTISPECIES: hypothetical protein [Halomonas]MCW4153380.1 hypothetical protein [Halomonas sp. 18H]MDN3553807.1 hypothetical protein [Halomonas almeriensis]